MLLHTTNLYKFIVKYPVIYYAFRSWKNVFVPFLCSALQIDECVELCQKEEDFAQMNLRLKVENDFFLLLIPPKQCFRYLKTALYLRILNTISNTERYVTVSMKLESVYKNFTDK